MRKFKEIPEYIKEFIGYSEESPSGLVWLKSTNRKIKVGAPVGCLKPTGYWEIRFEKKEYLAHRVVFFLKNGTCPPSVIVDHIDGNPSNNKENNLREATCQQNSSNSKRHIDKEGKLPKGIYEDKRKPGCFFAAITYKSKRYTKGSKSIDFLSKWILDKRETLHKEFSNNGS